jgi:ParB-like chromosome segregation protein Spo0J
MPQTFTLNLSQLAVVDRGRREMGDLQSLGQSLKARQISAITVRETSDADVERFGLNKEETPWTLVAGGRRVAAAILVGIDKLRAENWAELSDLEQKIIELEENVNRLEMTWAEQDSLRAQIHDFQRQLKGPEWSQKDTADHLGVSTATISRSIKVAEAIQRDPSIKEAGSSKAAARIIDMRETLDRRALQSQNVGLIQTLKQSLVQADARDFLRHLGTASVDHTFTDFPYGINFYSTGHKSHSAHDQPQGGASEYDDSEGVTLDLLTDVVPEILRTTRLTGWIVGFMSEANYNFLKDLFETCCVTHYQYGKIKYIEQANGDWTRVLPKNCSIDKDCRFVRAEEPRWLWFRPNSNNPSRFPERHAMNFYEPMLVVNRGEGRLLKHQQQCPNVLMHDSEYGDRIHSMQKPLSLCRDVVERISLPMEVVCDPFFGSGALLKAAMQLGRGVIGCEKNNLLVEQAWANTAADFKGLTAKAGT